MAGTANLLPTLRIHIFIRKKEFAPFCGAGEGSYRVVMSRFRAALKNQIWVTVEWGYSSSRFSNLKKPHLNTTDNQSLILSWLKFLRHLRQCSPVEMNLFIKVGKFYIFIMVETCSIVNVIATGTCCCISIIISYIPLCVTISKTDCWQRIFVFFFGFDSGEKETKRKYVDWFRGVAWKPDPDLTWVFHTKRCWSHCTHSYWIEMW